MIPTTVLADILIIIGREGLSSQLLVLSMKLPMMDSTVGVATCVALGHASGAVISSAKTDDKRERTVRMSR
jgi:hypothetical protein